MNLTSILLILVSVSLSVCAQILLKQGMSNSNIQSSFEIGFLSGVTSIICNYYVLSGLFAYVASAGVWLGVLAKVEVSKAYPFVGLGFIGTMLSANWFLSEPITTTKLLGTLLIITGVFFVSR
ncbi:EamA family transporter [Alteromonas portus]|uniref:EamA family transporter n=1 Tax=Alteromonas portus TaxID=2565549 RepID=UPI003BF8F8D5